LPENAKQKGLLRITGTYEEFMRTAILHNTFTSSRNATAFQPDATAHAGPPPDDVPLASKPGVQSCDRRAQELVWILILFLIFLYVAGSYLFWARVECAWPFRF